MLKNRQVLLLTQYGSQDWEAHYARHTGNGAMVWGPDPQLTPLGEEQARAMHALWMATRASADPPPLPAQLFSSPLQRSLHTACLTWAGVPGAPRHVRVLDALREVCGKNTCDQRRSRAALLRTPTALPFTLEEPFAESDELWTVRSTTHLAGARVGRCDACTRACCAGRDMGERRGRDNGCVAYD